MDNNVAVMMLFGCWSLLFGGSLPTDVAAGFSTFFRTRTHLPTHIPCVNTRKRKKKRDDAHLLNCGIGTCVGDERGRWAATAVKQTNNTSSRVVQRGLFSSFRLLSNLKR
jgi:hypothetical protein